MHSYVNGHSTLETTNRNYINRFYKNGLDERELVLYCAKTWSNLLANGTPNANYSIMDDPVELTNTSVSPNYMVTTMATPVIRHG